MLDKNCFDLELNSFAAFNDAAEICRFLRAMTDNDYTVSSDNHLGFTILRINQNTKQQQEDDAYNHGKLFYRQALRGFIPHYLEIAIGALLIISPYTVLDWLIAGLNIQIIPEWISLPLWSDVLSLAGLLLFLYGLRFIYSYYAASLCFDNDSVTLKKGIIARDQVQIRFSDIKTTNIHQSILDRLLGIGTLNLDSAGTNGTVDIVFPNLINPVYMRQHIQYLMDMCVKNKA